MTIADWIREKLGQAPQQTAVAYPSVAYAAPIPARVPVAAAMNPTANVGSTEPATLVSSTPHTKSTSSDNRSSLISGR